MSRVTTHIPLEIGERHHKHLRRIYCKVKLRQPAVNTIYSLCIPVKGMNDSMEKSGLVPFCLVFGIIPRLPILNTDLPKQIDGMETIKSARA